MPNNGLAGPAQEFIPIARAVTKLSDNSAIAGRRRPRVAFGMINNREDLK